MKALIVEDEMIVARDLAHILKEVGYCVCGVTTNVDEALDIVLVNQPDVVLIDIVLKGDRDGIDLAHVLREENNIPFLFITSHADRATVERAKAAHPSGYLVKPFTRDEVYAATEIALINYADGQADPLNSNEDEDGLPPFRLAKVKEYVEEHLNEDLTLSELAGIAGMSKYYFSRLFKQSEGIPPYEYVLERRVEVGKELLRDTDLSLVQIALKTGFSSQSHFGKIFRRQVGVTPAAYREAQ